MRFFKTIQNIFSIEELRTRILSTIGFIIVYRIGSYILLPGINYAAIKGQSVDGILGLLDNFLGGAFSNKAIFGLGIMPYISASIVLQLMQIAIPYFQRLQKEGESGRKKITQITRVLTIVICAFQSIGFTALAVNDGSLLPGVDPLYFRMYGGVILVAGTVFCMWLGEKITEKGIGNGISMLIMVGIISRLPAALIYEFTDKKIEGALFLVLEMVVLFFVILGVVMLTQAVRRIPVNYAKQIVGNKVYGGQRQYIPLKVNTAGVMPIIFAQALMFVPGMVIGFIGADNEVLSAVIQSMTSQYSWGYSVASAILIVLFTYFYTAITLNPNQIADDLKRNGGFVPGIKPGAPTADFIDTVLSRITLPGALFVAVVAILPAVAYNMEVHQQFALFFGGTSLLIMVGVILDTLQQIESYLLMREYEGMMKSGKLKSRTQTMAVA